MPFLFAGHDPGSLNHIRPLFELAKQSGRKVFFEEMRSKDGSNWGGLKQGIELLAKVQGTLLSNDGPIVCCVCGISTNKAELSLIQACKERNIPTVMVIDFAPGHRLKTEAPHLQHPSFFLVSNETAKAEVIDMYNVPKSRVALCGSTYLESLTKDSSSVDFCRAEVLGAYSIPEDCQPQLVPMFLAPDDMVPDSLVAIPCCLELLAKHLPPQYTIIVRPHPRNHKETLSALSQLCSSAGSARRDSATRGLAGDPPRMVIHAQDKIDNKSLCRACEFTLSMGSTVSVESVAWGVSSGFFQMAWDPTRIEAIMQTLPVPRITCADELHTFIAGPGGDNWQLAFGHLGCVNEKGEYDIENCIGAAKRSWDIIENMVDDISREHH